MYNYTRMNFDSIFIIIIMFIIIILLILIYCNKKINLSEHYNNLIDKKPNLWIYWENQKDAEMPPYIKLCFISVYKHCNNSFNIIKLDDKNIYDYLPELKSKNFNFSNLFIAQKVDYYRIFLLYKYGGLYLDADTLVLRDPIEILDKLKDYDFVGFGCTGGRCNYGYGKPSNGILASRKNGKLMKNVLSRIENKLEKNNKDKKYDYFDFGKYLIWEEIAKLQKKENYKYYHYSNDYDGTRDINKRWINTLILFSNKKLIYRNPEKMFFIILYNSGMGKFKNMKEEQLLNSDMNITKYYRKSLLDK